MKNIIVILMAIVTLASPPILLATDRKPVRSIKEMREDRVVMQKWDMSCGAAALATLLVYQHGDPVSEQDIARTLITRDEYISDPSILQKNEGFSLMDLKKYVDNRGYKGIGFSHLTLSDLTNRSPVIVPINFHGYNHFVIFRGMRGNQVLLADPAWGNRTISKNQFESIWIDYPSLGKVGFVVTKQNPQNQTNNMAPTDKDFMMFSPRNL